MTMQQTFPWYDEEDGPKTLGEYIKPKEFRPTIDSGLGAVQHGDYNLPGRGVKHDVGKPKFHLLPFDLMDGEQRVWEYGAKKYAPNQWRRGMPVSQAMNAGMRHLTAFMAGENNDPETGESHLDHLICCIRMAQNTLKNHKELDDRPRSSNNNNKGE